MLSHLQDLYVPCGKQRTGRRELVNRVKKLSVYMILHLYHI
jgi:hypothetical protein